MVLFPGCSKPADEKAAGAAEKVPDQNKAGVTIDAETQTRIGLKMETPTAAEWQPELHAVGRVVDPLVFVAAVADYETARAAAVASSSEWERMQMLAAQDNASPRALEAARAMAAHDSLALKAARAKFTADWGTHLAARTNLTELAEALQTDDKALVKLTLPAGTFPSPLPAAATIYFFNDETKSAAADFADDLGIDPATQVQTLLFSVGKKLRPSLSLTASLKISGEPVGGVTVPSSAVLRYEGKGWIYVQTGEGQFLRTEIPLDHVTENGWFVSSGLSSTNRIVVTGAQTILSAEMSGGDFNTGTRD